MWCRKLEILYGVYIQLWISVYFYVVLAALMHRLRYQVSRLGQSWPISVKHAKHYCAFQSNFCLVATEQLNHQRSVASTESAVAAYRAVDETYPARQVFHWSETVLLAAAQSHMLATKRFEQVSVVRYRRQRDVCMMQYNKT